MNDSIWDIQKPVPTYNEIKETILRQRREVKVLRRIIQIERLLRKLRADQH